jgi:hypothetical protein
MAITDGYATLADVKAALRITDTVDDSLLEISIEAASREIDGWCERVFTSSTATRVYRPTDVFTVETDDIQSITTLKTDVDGDGVFEITWDITDFQLEPLNGISGGIKSPFYVIKAVGSYLFPIYEPRNVNSNDASVQVTGVFGFRNYSYSCEAGHNPAGYATVQTLRLPYRRDGFRRFGCDACGQGRS